MSEANAKVHLNPHEVPPQVLKDLFKIWKGSVSPSADEILRRVVEDGMTSVESISQASLKEVFQEFHSGSGQLEDVSDCGSVYRSEVIPGLFFLPALLPPSTQQDLLSKLLHRDLSDPKHKTNLHLHYNVKYPKEQYSFFSNDANEVAFHPKDTTVHKPLTTKAAVEKKIRWVTLGGQYDWTNKVYPSEQPPQFPPDIANLIRGLFPAMEPQAAIVNLYSPGDTLSLHRDVSEEVDRGLVSVSLGCDAIFIIGLHHNDSGAIRSTVIRLRSGDAVYMTGESRFAWHAVPKIVPRTCPAYLEDWPGSDFPEWKGWISNKRINLNVRQMRE